MTRWSVGVFFGLQRVPSRTCQTNSHSRVEDFLLMGFCAWDYGHDGAGSCNTGSVFTHGAEFGC